MVSTNRPGHLPHSQSSHQLVAISVGTGSLSCVWGGGDTLPRYGLVFRRSGRIFPGSLPLMSYYLWRGYLLSVTSCAGRLSLLCWAGLMAHLARCDGGGGEGVRGWWWVERLDVCCSYYLSVAGQWQPLPKHYYILTSSPSTYQPRSLSTGSAVYFWRQIQSEARPSDE